MRKRLENSFPDSFPTLTTTNKENLKIGCQTPFLLLANPLFCFCQNHFSPSLVPFLLLANPFFTYGSFEHEPLCVKRLRNLALSYDGVMAYFSLEKSQKKISTFWDLARPSRRAPLIRLDKTFFFETYKYPVSDDNVIQNLDTDLIARLDELLCRSDVLLARLRIA